MSRRAGFSLTELMVTVLVMGILAAFSAPAVFKAISRWNLHTSRQLVISEVKLLREKAVTQGRPLRIWFSPGSNLYWFLNPKTNVWVSYQLPSRVTFYSVAFPGSSPPYYTIMQPDGRSSASGTVILVNNTGQKDTVVVNLSGWVGQP